MKYMNLKFMKLWIFEIMRYENLKLWGYESLNLWGYDVTYENMIFWIYKVVNLWSHEAMDSWSYGFMKLWIHEAMNFLNLRFYGFFQFLNFLSVWIFKILKALKMLSSESALKASWRSTEKSFDFLWILAKWLRMKMKMKKQFLRPLPLVTVKNWLWDVAKLIWKCILELLGSTCFAGAS